LFPLFHV
jgi:hypothetical protein